MTAHQHTKPRHFIIRTVYWPRDCVYPALGGCLDENEWERDGQDEVAVAANGLVMFF